MTIHVVKSGDSLWSISRQHGVSMQSITETNKLDELPRLVIGQALVIPTGERAYTVRSGDTLWSISRRYGVPVNEIAQINEIPPPYVLRPGTVLRIPTESENYGFLEVNAYIEPSTSEKETRLINEVGNYLTYLSTFSYEVRADGSLSTLKDETMLAAARPFRAAALMVITNFSEGNFSTDIAHSILTSDSIQQTLINNIISTMRTKGYYGINIDFERVLPADRELYNNFLRKVVNALHPLNYVVSTALAPKLSATQVGEWYEAHDYRAHGEIVDFVIIMTYEWGWSGGPPLPVAPINMVRRVLDYAVSVIPRKKIMMGMPLYGYNWPLPYVKGGKFAPRISPQQAIRLAARYGANIQYDEKAQSPFFNYYDENKVQHIVWFEDARSTRAKFLTANEYGLRGVSYWVLGSDFPQTWVLVGDMFNIVKVIR